MIDQSSEQPIIGSVLRASTVGFVCGTRSQDIAHPSFGAFVRTHHGDYSGIDVIGLIHAISIDDDPLVRQMILANNMNEAVVSDQRTHRMVPVEISIINVGYIEYGAIYQTLPPRPPLSLDPVQLCDPDTVRRFTEQLGFLRVVLNTSASDMPTEELLGASVKHATNARPEELRYEYLVAAGRQLAGLLAHDLPRLQHLLHLIRPA